MRNQETAALLRTIADLLEANGEDRFKIRAYRVAAQAIDTLDEDIEAAWREGRLEEIPGVGEGIARKVSEFLSTGRMAKLDELLKVAPREFEALVRLEGLGPKRVFLLYRKLGVGTLKDLEAAALEGKIRGLEGFGEKSEKNILGKLKSLQPGKQRTPYAEAKKKADAFLALLQTRPEIQKAEAAGSLRRRKRTIGDLDLLVVSSEPAKTSDFFASMPAVTAVLAKGKKKASVVLKGGMQADLRIVSQREWGSMLLYFTGSKAHNIDLRKAAQDKGWKLNEYGLFDAKGKLLASKTEEEIYKKLGFAYVPPEKREEAGVLKRFGVASGATVLKRLGKRAAFRH